MKKLVYIILCCMTLVGLFGTSVSALNKTDVLECCFTNDNRYMKIFVNGKVSDSTLVSITKKDYTPEIHNTGVEVRTTFLLDNTSSFPNNMRDVAKQAIVDYVRRLGQNESVRLAAFGKNLISLSDNFTRDASYIEYALTKVTFDQNGSYVYDAIKQAIEQFYGNDDAYYRLVVLTDGITEQYGGSISFDYLQKMIASDNKQHIDFIQVCKTNTTRENTNMKSLSLLSSNTFYMMYSGHTDLQYLRPNDISLLKVPMNDALMTGEYKGVTVAENSSRIDVGSIFFPQVTLGIQDTAVSAAISDTAAALDADATKQQGNSSFPLVIVIVIASAVVLALVGVIVFMVLGNKLKQKVAVLEVCVIKEDQRDTDGIGYQRWWFPITKDFRVGRTLNPLDNAGNTKGQNDYAICERADQSKINGIGRVAFAICYKEHEKAFYIQNIAEHARFVLEIGERQSTVQNGDSVKLDVGANILLGYYTTVRIDSMDIKTWKKRDIERLKR